MLYTCGNAQDAGVILSILMNKSAKGILELRKEEHIATLGPYLYTDMN